MKVFNKGKRPIVYQDNRFGKLAIHPGKFVEENEKTAKEIIKRFDNAVPESEFKKKPVGRPKAE